MPADALPPLPLNAWLRYDLIDRSLRELPPDVHTVLEIGAGAGAIGARLARRYEYTGIEPDPAAYARAAERLGAERIVCGDSSALDPASAFDLVCSFEVLEHLEDDRAALLDWRGRLREGGFIALSVPARPNRFGPHDRVVGHYRRYDAHMLARLLEDCGFVDVRVRTCGFPLGYALEAARNLIARLHARRGGASMAEQTAASGRWLQPPDAIAWLTAAVAAPFRLLQRPFARTLLGTGLVAVARRPV
ncbi:MAG TPA: methyltransferase domain-containing protein [Gaiellaceae bacterium]|nr:methyltransferase domain-containing protein [Gaiellaceae bacterium]